MKIYDEEDDNNLMSRGGLEDGETSESEMTQYKKREVWDKKELEKRTEIANKFWKVGLVDDINDLIELIKNSNKDFIALEMRIGFTPEQYHSFNNILRDINEHIGASQSLLDSYIMFSNSTPKFENMQTSLYNFHMFITQEESRPFHQIKVKKAGVYYFRVSKMNQYVKEITFLLSRLIGTLRTAGNYIIDSENETRQNGQGMDDRIRGMGNYGGYSQFDNMYRGGINNGGLNFDKFGNINVTKINTPKKRDFGDGEGES